MAKIGRPTKFTKELAENICERLAEGETLTDICEADEMPTRVTVYRWTQSDAVFRNKYAHARRLQADSYADKMLAVAFNSNPDQCQVSRLQVDTLKFIASKLNPGAWGSLREEQAQATDPTAQKLLDLLTRGAKADAE